MGTIAEQIGELELSINQSHSIMLQGLSDFCKTMSKESETKKRKEQFKRYAHSFWALSKLAIQMDKSAYRRAKKLVNF